LNSNIYHVIGGVGDLLLSVEAATFAKEIQVFSHFSRAPDIFKPFDVNVYRFEYYRAVEELNSFYIPGSPLIRAPYWSPDIALPDPPFLKPKGKKVVGVHPTGSRLSNDFWSKRGEPIKDLSDDFLVNLLKQIKARVSDAYVYLFCAPEDKGKTIEAALKAGVENFLIASFPDIWKSLSLVQHCDAVIGADSCIKTMSCMLKIPTMVLMGDYIDPFRDENFIDPYVKDQILYAIRFAKLEDINPETAIELFKEICL
jgi:ADP-heptose:LPS heptosyltransferase